MLVNLILVRIRVLVWSVLPGWRSKACEWKSRPGEGGRAGHRWAAREMKGDGRTDRTRRGKSTWAGCLRGMACGTNTQSNGSEEAKGGLQQSMTN